MQREWFNKLISHLQHLSRFSTLALPITFVFYFSFPWCIWKWISKIKCLSFFCTSVFIIKYMYNLHSYSIIDLSNKTSDNTLVSIIKIPTFVQKCLYLFQVRLNQWSHLIWLLCMLISIWHQFIFIIAIYFKSIYLYY